MTKVAIVGNQPDKFENEDKVTDEISKLMKTVKTVIIGGHEGMDAWVWQMANRDEIPVEVFKPTRKTWAGEGGLAERNMMIANECDEIHIFVSSAYPENYNGVIYNRCYHCGDKRPWHVKSGGCWTAVQAEKMGKNAVWHII